MNQVLSKCVDELKTPTPRIDYVLGMLETLMEMQDVPIKTINPLLTVPLTGVLNNYSTPTAPAVLPAVMDEAAVMEAQTKSYLDVMKAKGVTIS